MTSGNANFNACDYLLGHRQWAGDGGRLALTGVGGDVTYDALHERVVRTQHGLHSLGLQPEQRIVLFMADSPQLVTVYLAAMRMGAVPVPVSTMSHADGLAELLRDSRARMLAVTAEYASVAGQAIADAPELTAVLAGPGSDLSNTTVAVHQLEELATGPVAESAYPTSADSPAFWLYTSGTTGSPKAAMHRHGSIRTVCETYASHVLGITPDDRCLSVAKAFFAYGLGNSLLFPLSVGACAVLDPAPAKPEVMVERIAAFGATLFFASPTFLATMLRVGLPTDALRGVRLAVSAGESLPAALYERWTQHFGVEVIDGLGMTETLHIFLSNQPGHVRPGSTGVAVPGYDLRLVDERGHDVPEGSSGTLLVRGASAATGYWSRYDASRQVFQGEWLRTGDTYVRDADGFYTCLGRTGDMLKASGIWVSPTEVEDRLLSHASVAQAVVVAAPDPDGLDKPVAYVVLQPGSAAAEGELIEFCRAALPSFKRPRKIIFVDGYPTTATGKVRRVELRAMAATALSDEPAG